MFELKPLSKDAIPAALEKAERYRLLNEPWQAESICRDVLAQEPDNQRALIMLLLSVTDQFKTEGAAERLEDARELLGRLTGEYERAYYAGIIQERRGTALLAGRDAGRGIGSGPVIYGHLRRAMAHYEEAEPLRRPGEESARLRWNTCARIIMTHAEVEPEPARRGEIFLE